MVIQTEHSIESKVCKKMTEGHIAQYGLSKPGKQVVYSGPEFGGFRKQKYVKLRTEMVSYAKSHARKNPLNFDKNCFFVP